MTGRAGFGAGMPGWPGGTLVGRDDLIGELAAAADDARHSSGGVILLAGEAGIGKTSVARVLARQARDELAVSWGVCPSDHSAPPFWPWRAAVSADEVRRARERDESTDVAIGAGRFDRLNELREGLFARARDEPLLHIIEDLQWADVASVLLLAHIAPASLHIPLLVVGTLRTGETLAPDLEDAIEEVRRSARVRDVQPLGNDDIERMIRAADIEADADLTELVGARTGGNPLFVAELLRVVRLTDADQRVDALAHRVPTRVSELVAHELARLPAAVSEVLATAAVVGSEGDVRTLAAACASTVESVVDLLEQARAAHVLDAAPPGRWQFRHELIRDAMYERMTSASRARCHAAVLEVLATDGSTPASVLAQHALSAQPLFDLHRAVALAARAGEVAFSQHAYEEAVTWFTRALSSAPADATAQWRAEQLLRCGEAHRHLGHIPDARPAFLAAAELIDHPALLARAALGYADSGADLGIAYRSDDPVTAAVLDRAIAAQPAGDSVTTVMLEARLAAELYFSDEPGRARTLASSAVDRAQRLGDPRALGAATAVVHDAFVIGQQPLDAQLRESEQLLEWARETQSAAALLTAHRARVFDELAAGDIAGMDREIVAFQRIAEPLRAPSYLWWPSLWSAMRALLAGRHDEAEGRAVAAYEIGRAPFDSLAFLNLSFFLFFLRREQGRLAELEAPVRDAVAARADIPALRVGLTFLLAELGRLDEVRGLCAALDDDGLDRLHDRNWPASWFQLARVAAIAGDRSLATTLLKRGNLPSERCVMVSLATACLGAADLATAWLFHTVGDLDAAAAKYEAATTMNSRIGARSWLIQTHADHARLLLDRNRGEDENAARELLDVAARGARDIGLPSITRTIAELEERLDPSLDLGAARAAEGSTTATFRRAGPVWDVEFGTRSVHVRHVRGMIDIAYLLARPREAVSALALAGSEGAHIAGDRGEAVFDERARREVRERLRELDVEIAEADAAGDTEAAALGREQLQTLAESFARDVGLGGRPRRVGDSVERARKTVSTRIRRAIAAVSAVHPELGRHLTRSIDTGTWCAYRPAEVVVWKT